MNIFKKQLKKVKYKPEKPETIKCYFCKHLVEKQDCKILKVGSSTFYRETSEYYCNLHTLKYDSMVYSGGYCKYYKHIEVTEDGKVIKKKK